MRLVDALRLSNSPRLAMVGAGGKTTALFSIAHELLSKKENKSYYSTVLVTSSTHFGAWQIKQADHFYRVSTQKDIRRLSNDLPIGVVILAGEERENRLTGLNAELMENIRLVAEEKHLPLLIEADGSARLPLKAPANHEPAIPEFVDYVVVVAGLSGLGKPICNQWIHRPEIYAKLSGRRLGDEVTCEAITKVLCSIEGGLKNIPASARRYVLLNQVDNAGLLEQAKSISRELLGEYHGVIIAALGMDYETKTRPDKAYSQKGKIYSCAQRIGGIILAAGSSSRFGAPKQVLDWKGTSFIRHVVKSALHAELAPVVVVLGSSAEEIGKEVSDYPVRIVNNSKWKDGLSTSIRAGLMALPDETGAAVFLQADQPQTSAELIRRLVETHSMTLSPIIAPKIDGKRGNPVLFDRQTFTDLLTLQGDTGGRELFNRYPLEWVVWDDRRQLMDVDDPKDYRTFLDSLTDPGDMQ